MLSQVPSGTTQIIAKGGGSTIDVAKYVAGELEIPLTVYPTTAGTGSEVTRYVVLTVDGKKKTFASDKYIPTAYVLDPTLVTSLPYLHTVASGFDALSQAMESFWSKNATTESKLYSKLAMELVWQNLKKCVDDPKDTTARMNMLLAANFSGRAINITKTNICHAISYPLTDWYGVPHGIACAFTLPYFSKKFLGIDLSEFINEFTIPFYEINIKKVSKEVITSEKLKDCPIEITRKDLLSSLSEALDTWTYSMS